MAAEMTAASGERPPVAIVMGSQSDWETLRHAAATLDELGVPYSAAIASGVMPVRFVAFTFAPARISMSASSVSCRYIAQCKAVAPSTCGALTSAFWRISFWTAARSPLCAASAMSLLPAPETSAEAMATNATQATTTRLIIVFNRATSAEDLCCRPASPV